MNGRQERKRERQDRKEPQQQRVKEKHAPPLSNEEASAAREPRFTGRHATLVNARARV
jgi:hypothetical protein